MRECANRVSRHRGYRRRGRPRDATRWDDGADEGDDEWEFISFGRARRARRRRRRRRRGRARSVDARTVGRATSRYDGWIRFDSIGFDWIGLDWIRTCVFVEWGD